MNIDALVKGSALAGPLVLCVSTAIAVMVYRYTRRQGQMEMLKLVHSRWQDMNRFLIERPDIQRLLGDTRFQDKSDEEIIIYNFIFQVLNLCYELHFARRRGLVDRAVADQFMAGNIEVLRGRSKEVLDILSWNRSYDAAFCTLVRNRLDDTTPPEPATALTA